MSFRVKTTSKLLDTSPAPPEKKENFFFLDLDEKSNNFLSASSARKPANPPKVGVNVGMAIRSVPTAPSDHM